jgi:hypothetical protein
VVNRLPLSMAAEDIISTLPDAILCHILSFLPTKKAVGTSILSHRWKHLYRSVPVLEFTDIYVQDQNSNFNFNDFVSSILLSRDPAFPIKTFRIDIGYRYSLRLHFYLHNPVNRMTKWINFMVQRGVECLDLKIDIYSDRCVQITHHNSHLQNPCCSQAF